MSAEELIHYVPHVLVIALLVWKGGYIIKTYIFTPLAGGNGVIQMDELAKFNILLMCWFALVKQANRPDLTKDIFSNETFLILLGSLLTIAGFKHIKFWPQQPKEKAHDHHDKGAA